VAEAATLGAPKSWRARLLPAVLVLLCGWCVVLLRDPMPLDETRYAEVFRELLSGSKLVLTLNSEGYSHKTPLLFWFAWVAHGAGLSLAAAMMVWPAIFSSLTVLLVGRMGARLGMRHADWIQAGMVMPLVLSGIVLFDSMLALFVWLFLWARFDDRPWVAMLASIPMMMAKGPAALVFAIPYGIVFGPPKSTTRGWRARLPVQLLPGLLVLGGWAYVAILKAGASNAEEGQFAANLAWNQTAGRVVNSFAHARSIYWYVPILIAATLPYTGQLLLPLRRLRRTTSERPLLSQLVLASAVVFLVWSLISGKQAHYLMPMLPAMALLFAADFEERPALLGRTHFTAAAFLLLFVGILLTLRFGWIVDPLADYGERSDQLRGSLYWNTLLFGGCALGVGAAAFLAAKRPTLPGTAGVFLVGMVAMLAPLHGGLHHLVLPQTMIVEPYLSELRAHPLATIGNQQAGLYNLYFEVDHIERLSPGDATEIEAWITAHPDGALLVEEKNLAVLEGLALRPLVRDRIRAKQNWAMLVSPGAQLDLGFLAEWDAKPERFEPEGRIERE